MSDKSDKRKILIDSVRKLIELKVPDNEIALNLKEVGIDEKQARHLIKVAKQPPKEKEEKEEEKHVEEKKPAEAAEEKKPVPEKPGKESKEEKLTEEILEQAAAGKKPKRGFFDRFKRKPRPVEAAEKPPVTEEEKTEEEIAEAVAPPEEEKPEPEPKPVPEPVPKPAPKPAFPRAEAKPEEKKELKPIAPIQPVPPAKPVDISKLWEKGILSAIDQKLKEIKEIKEDLDKAIAKKSDELAKKEIEKIQVLFESQQDLFLEKVNAQLEKKGKEVEQLVDQKILEMRGTSKELEKEMQQLEKKRQEYKEYLDEIDLRLAELDKTKGRLVSEMNSELIKSKSSMQEFLDSSQSKIQEMDDRVNKTLEVASSAIEGLKADTEGTLKEMGVRRSDELNQELTTQLAELKETRMAFESQIKERLVRLDELQRAIQQEFNPEMFKQQMADLEVFKAQFVKVIEQNVSKFNKAIHRINEDGAIMEEQISKRIRLINRKMKELDAFEQHFAEEMGVAVEMGFEKKKAKKKKK